MGSPSSGPDSCCAWYEVLPDRPIFQKKAEMWVFMGFSRLKKIGNKSRRFSKPRASQTKHVYLQNLACGLPLGTCAFTMGLVGYPVGDPVSGPGRESEGSAQNLRDAETLDNLDEEYFTTIF